MKWGYFNRYILYAKCCDLMDNNELVFNFYEFIDIPALLIKNIKLLLF